MKKLLIATTNPAKFAEIKKFLSDLPCVLVSLADVGITDDVVEDGATFEENAKKKALFYAERSGLPTISDDGGLEVDVLDGAPGVYSKRWIGRENATTQEYIDFVLDKMKDVADDARGAQLRTVVAYAEPGGKAETAEEKVRGIIPLHASGYREEGFPYRALLFIPELGKFYNHMEMTEDEEEKYNHRKKALEKLKKYIVNLPRKSDILAHNIK